MALFNCPECGNKISDEAEKCIYCGFPIKRKTEKSEKQNKKYLAVVVIVVGVFGFLIFASIERKVSNNDKEKIAKGVEIANEQNKTEGFAEDKEETIFFSKDSKITTSSCEFSLTGYVIADKIEPKNYSGSYYHYFEANSGNVYVDVKFMIKNLQSEEVLQDEIVNKVEIIYDDTYEYNCSFVTVNSDGDFESFTNLYGISPLMTLEYHMLAEVPEEVKNSEKGLVCRIETDKKIYECTLR